MAETYKCECSTCYRGSKFRTRRTIENHLQQDLEALQTRKLSSSNMQLLSFMQSRIDLTVKLLASIHGGPKKLETVSDPDGSRSEGVEGASLRRFRS